VELDDADDSRDKKATKALPATELEIDQPHFRLCEIRSGSVPDARQRQPSTESYRANIQTGLILGPTKTIYRHQRYYLVKNPDKTWSYKYKGTFSEFAKYALAGARAGKFSSTWSICSISMSPLSGQLRIN
jgi:hypothetical protein